MSAGLKTRPFISLHSCMRDFISVMLVVNARVKLCNAILIQLCDLRVLCYLQPCCSVTRQMQRNHRKIHFIGIVQVLCVLFPTNRLFLSYAVNLARIYYVLCLRNILYPALSCLPTLQFPVEHAKLCPLGDNNGC